MIPNRQIQWTEAMSRERFVQEAMLIALQQLLRNASAHALNEQGCEQLASQAREIAYALDEAFGNPNIPRLEGKA